MGKQGPCCHCGVTSTPLWRNGPSDKPVLCNACGSRWRTKGTLVNYTPLHLRAEPDEDSKTSRMRRMFMKKNETMKVRKRKLYSGGDDADVADFVSDEGNHGLCKSFDEGGSNRSSSGSAISNSDSCALFGGTDASELTGPSQGTAWDMNMVPSKKRTRISRPKSSPVEKLRNDLYKILKEQQASSMSDIISEDDVLLETNHPTVSVEIGHGSVLIRHPSSIIAREEESEASSLSFDYKLHPVNEAYSRLKTLPLVNNDITVANIPCSGIEKIKKIPSQCSIQQQDQTKRELLEKLQMLGHHNSPLRYVDLKNVVNFDVFLNCLSSDEQLQMDKYLPSFDTFRSLESMKNMFESPQFKETLSSFQKLLGEGVFDNSLSGVTIDDCRKLQRLLLCSLVQSKWVQQYTTLKGLKSKGSTPVSEVVAACQSVNMSRTFQETKSIPKCPKTSTVKINPTIRDETLENDSLGFSPRNLFTAPSDNIAGVLSPLRSTYGGGGGGGGSDQDLLLDIPSYSSFPQAELLYPSVLHRPLRP